VLGNLASTGAESFEQGRLEYPQYTRPPEFRGEKVPEVLLSGDHARIARWRRAMSLRTTRDRRPDLFSRIALSDEDWELLKELQDAEGESHAQQDP
jgi:tRNA (guanine37-N1)-methyltransferase